MGTRTKKVWKAGVDGLHKVLSQPKGGLGPEMTPQRPSQTEVRAWSIFFLGLVTGTGCPWKQAPPAM